MISGEQRMNPPSLLETERLVLRAPCAEDAEAIFQEYAQDPAVTRYLVWTPHENIEQTRTFLGRCADAWAKGDEFPWAITQRGEGRCVGMVSLRAHEFKADLGYVLARRLWGKGLMTEAAKRVVHWAFAQPQIFRVWAICDVENSASARVMEKLGMVREGVLRRWMRHPNISPEPRDCLCYAKVR
jgi:RimJ/RimL family protein N-acetyltransferase